MTLRPSCVILGGGGHASVLIDILQISGSVDIVGITDSDPSKWKRTILGIPILGNDEELEKIHTMVTCFVVGVGTVGKSTIRQQLYQIGLDHKLTPLNVIHPTAFVSKWAKIGEGVQLLPGCIINTNAVLGNNIIINSGAIVEHDCLIGSHVHIATGARLASTVHVADGVHIGIGATIKQCVSIGAGAVIGAGSVVIHDVKPRCIVAGVPAHEIG